MKCKLAKSIKLPLDEEVLLKDPWKLNEMTVIILTEATYEEIDFMNKFCRKHNIKFISCDVYGVFSRIFNDFGNKFEVLDKNGEEL